MTIKFFCQTEKETNKQHECHKSPLKVSRVRDFPLLHYYEYYYYSRQNTHLKPKYILLGLHLAKSDTKAETGVGVSSEESAKRADDYINRFHDLLRGVGVRSKTPIPSPSPVKTG